MIEVPVVRALLLLVSVGHADRFLYLQALRLQDLEGHLLDDLQQWRNQFLLF